MNLRVTSPRILTAAVVAIAAGVAIQSHGWSHALLGVAHVSEYTAEELACAQSLGVELRSSPYPPSPTFERHLAWKSELIAYGTVEEIQHDIRGAYPTIATIRVLSTRKGEISEPTLRVNLFSGPRYHPLLKEIGEQHTAHEPRFVQGETVLLFLTTFYAQVGDGLYALPSGHYLLTRSTKWVAAGKNVYEDGNPAHTHTIDWINSEIDLVVQKQETLCQGE